MRSSIACVRCRRSKVKCVNSGVNTTCRACEAGGRDCTYPQPTPTGAAAAGASTSNATGDALKRPRPKKAATGAAGAGHTGGVVGVSGVQHAGQRKESPRARRGYSLDDALDTKILTHAVWKSLFDSFCQHFYPTFPFIHTPSFLDWLKAPPQPVGSSAQNPSAQGVHSPYLLLGVLTLTARFSQELVNAHVLPGHKPDPIGTSEYYASCLRYLLFAPSQSLPSAGTAGIEFGEPGLDKVQALLMLAFHEWGAMGRGVQAWTWIGVAMRMAEVLGLGVENPDPGFYKTDCFTSRPPALGFSAQSPQTTTLSLNPAKKDGWDEPPNKRRRMEAGRAEKEAFVEDEIKRRTFWAGFMLERSLASVQGRISKIRLDEINGTSNDFMHPSVVIRLPCADQQFFFRNKVVTGVLTLENDSIPTATEEGVVSRLLKAVEIWGRVQRWAVSTPDRTPAKETAGNLTKLTGGFLDLLPSQWHYNEDNLSAHTMSGSAPHFAMLHLTSFLSLIYLHRPFLQYIPLPPTAENGPPAEATQLFKAARGILDLVSQLDSALETPMVGFAVYSALIVAIYAKAFPWMDTQNFLSPQARSDDDHPMTSPPRQTAENMEDEEESEEILRKPLYLVANLSKTWNIATNLPVMLMHTYELYREVLKDSKVPWVYPTKSFMQLKNIMDAYLKTPEYRAGSKKFLPTPPQPPKEDAADSWTAINTGATPQQQVPGAAPFQQHQPQIPGQPTPSQPPVLAQGSGQFQPQQPGVPLQQQPPAPEQREQAPVAPMQVEPTPASRAVEEPVVESLQDKLKGITLWDARDLAGFIEGSLTGKGGWLGLVLGE